MSSEESAALPLSRFQQWMQQLLLDPFQQTGVEAVVNDSARLSAREHLAIYQRSYIARLRSCMAQQFSALEYALGEDLFRGFADEYLTLHPSRHYNLAELGAGFADCLQTARPDAEAEAKEDWIDFMIELARFEYAVGVLFEQQAEEDYQLAGMDDADEALALLPVCGLFAFQFPTSVFYSGFKRGENPELPFAGESHCVVLRHDYRLALYELQPEQHLFLSCLKKGTTLPLAKAEFCQRTGTEVAAFEPVWQQWKQHWTAARFFRKTET